MSFGIHVNILRCASDATNSRYDKASEFMRRCATGKDVFCLVWVTLMSYLRMATHASIFATPRTALEAAANVQALLNLPHCRAQGDDDGFWAIYREVMGVVPARGNLAPDAHLAAVLRQHGVARLYKDDRDFRKIDFLQVVDPLAD
ncbi:MAG: PIN domain-containing protein [Rhodocyclaceae bacterium]|nr:PIN domain-containing protein [Rhodocyclaceae bacterium]MBX3670556.1 PIN domain-containing protein [Rhodocyclaceae bacterium]